MAFRDQIFEVTRNSSNGEVTVTFSARFSDYGDIYVGPKKAASMLQKYQAKVKKWHNLKSISMYFDAVDCRDSDYDLSVEWYDAEWVRGSGKQKVSTEHREIYFLPKSFSVCYQIVLDSPKTISYIQKFAAMFGLDLENKQKTALRKVVKGEKRSYDWNNL